MKKTLKRIIAVTLAAAAVGTAAGCGSKKTSDDEATKIKWYLPADNSSNPNAEDIYAEAKQLLNEMYIKGTPIRLIGMRVDNLIEKDELRIEFFVLEFAIISFQSTIHYTIP